MDFQDTLESSPNICKSTDAPLPAVPVENSEDITGPSKQNAELALVPAECNI